MPVSSFLDLLLRLRRKPFCRKRSNHSIAKPQSQGEALEQRIVLSVDPVQLPDIAAGAASSTPRELVNVNGTLFFSANDGSAGTELWKVAATDATPVRVKDINLGAASSSPSELTNVNGTLFFRANDGSGGSELWKSDGTESGTVRVKDIFAGTDSSFPLYLTNVDGTLYFRANNGVTGYELWKSDGTDQGTTLVADINPGTAPSFPSDLKNVNGTLYFNADDGSSGRELWKSNSSGTTLVKEIFAGTNSSNIRSLTNVNGTLFFTASSSPISHGLWKTDGTSDGTVLVKNIAGGSGIYSPSYFTDVSGTLFFSARDISGNNDLWKSDGTSAGTVLVKDFAAGVTRPLTGFTNVSGTLYFAGNGTVGNYELWKSNGTAAGTVQVQEIASGSSSSLPTSLTNVNGTVYFSATEATGGRELWKSNGTAAGTVRVLDIFSGQSSSAPDSLVNVSGTLYFSATDGLAGVELWKVEGSDTNQSPTDINISTATFPEHNAPNATVATLSTTDPDLSDSFSYSLVEGVGSSDNSSFAITGNQLKIVPVTDFTTKAIYQLRIRVTDQGGLSFEKAFTINILEVNSAPTDISLSSSSLAENNVSGSDVGTLSAIDPDLADTLTFSLVSGTGATDNGQFSVSGNVLKINTTTDFETKSSYAIRIRVSDQEGLSFEKPFTVSITNVNEPPSLSGIAAQSISEDGSLSGLVFTVGDPETLAQNLVVTATSSNLELILNSSIQLAGTGSNRTISLTPAANQSGVSTITVTVSDGVLSTSQTFQVTVNPIDDPAQIVLSSQPLVLNGAVRKPVQVDATATISDVDSPSQSFAGAVLQVSGQLSSDTLSVLKRSGIRKKGKTIVSGDTVIGTLSGGRKGGSLSVQFNGSATQASVQTLLQSIGFKSTAKTSTSRSVRFQITNLGGLDTTPATRLIEIASS